MRCNDAFGDRQTETRSLPSMRSEPTALIEFFENGNQVIWRNTWTRVFHRNFQFSIHRLSRNPYLPAPRREFDRIPQQIPQDLQNAFGIEPHLRE